VVPEREKEMLWRELRKHFTFPAGSEALVKYWTMKKMATQLQTFKKNLKKNYIKKGKMPVFTGELEKQKDQWNAFVEYKCSELGIQWVERNKENASKKKYHHMSGIDPLGTARKLPMRKKKYDSC
jgi:hypothetical protein